MSGCGDRDVDVAVVGDGPAGSAMAQELTRRGVDTILLGSDRPWEATYTTWCDDLDGVGVVDGADVWLRRFATVQARFERSTTIRREYGVLDNTALRTVLRAGVDHRVQTVERATEVAARIVIDATGWPSGLDPDDRRLLLESEGGSRQVCWQTAWGAVLPGPPDGPLGVPTVMDFSVPDGPGDVGVPTFAYSFPVAGGWLIEETVLAGPRLDPDRLVPRLAARLGWSPETLRERAVRVERVRIPMGAPIPDRHGAATVRFGAAAGMIHTATGYSVASSLRAVERVADAIEGRLAAASTCGSSFGSSGDVEAIAAAVWPTPLRRTRRLHDYGLDVLLGLDGAEIRGFFQTFFDLPVERWSAYLRIDTPPRELAAVMTAAFTHADWALRRRLLTGNPRLLLSVLRP